MNVFQRFRADLSRQAVMQGMIVAIVGYASSVALVIQGLRAAGATAEQITSALVVLGIGKGVVAIGLSLYTRMPISIAWTTPGVALLAVTPAVAGGFPAVIGAFIATGLLIMLAGFWQPLGRLIAAIPRPIANAMLAGIILKLCLAPFTALKEAPVLAGALLLIWLVMMRVAKLYAVPVAVAAAVAAIIATGGAGGVAQGGAGAGGLLPSLTLTVPAFSAEAMVSLALPLFVVTMASQNITGLAVLSTFDYRPSPKLGLMVTGLFSAVTAPFGAPAINFAAITAALSASPDAHPDRDRRYIAAVVGGIGYIALAGLAGVATLLVITSSPLLIEAVAGLALLGSCAAALSGALQAEEDRIPAMATLLVTASGLAFFNIGPAFWGLVIGWGMHLFLAKRPLKTP